MANNEYNWALERRAVTDAAKRVATKAAKKEQELMKDGWRYVKLNDRVRCFVPCDAKGKPTKEGERMMREMSKRF